MKKIGVTIIWIPLYYIGFLAERVADWVRDWEAKYVGPEIYVQKEAGNEHNGNPAKR